MTNPRPFPDSEARLIAETTFDRNVVVLAGAGTGKTTLLVNRLIHALLREPDPVRLTDMVALTFTNKAANEMKIRLRDRLHGMLCVCHAEVRSGNSMEAGLEEYRQQYQVSTEQIAEKIQNALADLEKSQIATFHSFAAHILRLYPLESRVDPNFHEDDGTQFLEMFQETWNGWLELELGSHGASHARWQEVFTHIGLSDLQEFALSLCQDQISLRDLEQQVEAGYRAPAFISWLQNKQQQVGRLLKHHSREKPRKIEKLLVLAFQVFDRVRQGDQQSGPALSQSEMEWFNSAIGNPPGDWERVDFEDARRAIQSAQRLLQVNESVIGNMIHILAPFVERVRQVFSDKGFIRFDGLLIRVRNLLRDHPMVRDQLKRTYKAIMVDEFQDTDPVQYEILLYLGEKTGEHGREWRDLHLTPGKLFIVGDPKQSIYAFRRADIEAFDQVVDKLTHEGGVVCTLLTNFRSEGSVLQVVNAVFDRLFIPEAHVQPPNVPLAAGRMPETASGETGVEMWVMADKEDEWDTERATRLEAEWLAEWIETQLQSEQKTIREDGVSVLLRPGHFGILLRKFTTAQIYIEALQRRAIPCITDGEKHFYRRQEVIDLINVLRVLDDPTDTIALVGVLRSSLGGLTDQEIMEMVKIATLDIRTPHVLKQWHSSQTGVIQHLFRQLAVLHSRVTQLPVPDLLDHVFRHLPIVELAAASSHGEQAVANVWKLRDLISEQGAVPHLSFSAWIDRLTEFLSIPPVEQEAPLAEESPEAVRVLTIHKAKGLEFPIVILPGLHQKAIVNEGGADVSFDWISGLYGCTLPPVWNAGRVLLWEKDRIREEAEQRRVLYVGMTRARERLVLSGGIFPKRGRDSLMGLLQQIAHGEFGNAEEPCVTIGGVSIPQTVVTSGMVTPLKPARESPAPTEPKTHEVSPSPWDNRESRWLLLRKTDGYLTPSLLHTELPVDERGDRTSLSRGESQRLGTLMHRLLQGWDFQHDAKRTRAYLADFCQQHLSCDLEKGERGMAEDLEGLVDHFLLSPAYRELRRATLLGREVPFVIPWPVVRKDHLLPQNCVMEGIMDVVYELDGEIWVGDYKTDHVSSSEIQPRARMYREQAQVYALAASRALALNVKGCKLFFIRSGETVQVDLQIPTNECHEEKIMTRRNV